MNRAQINNFYTIRALHVRITDSSPVHSYNTY